MRNYQVQLQKGNIAFKILITSLFALLLIVRIAQPQGSSNGSVTVIIDSVEQEYTFNHRETLSELISREYTVVISYGRLLVIEDLESDFVNDYIVILVNGEYSNYGVLSIILCDGCVYEFKVEVIE